MNEETLKDLNELSNYSWSSYPIYIGKQSSDIISTNEILGFFSSKDKFIKFTEDQIDYQRELDKIKHLLLE